LLGERADRGSRAVDKVLAISGVDAIAKPAIDALRAKLDALSKA
jgi:hypothetical protein